jgi:hypothetical protein
LQKCSRVTHLNFRKLFNWKWLLNRAIATLQNAWQTYALPAGKELHPLPALIALTARQKHALPVAGALQLFPPFSHAF